METTTSSENKVRGPAHRAGDGIEMRLLWPQGSDSALVSVADPRVLEAFELELDTARRSTLSPPLRLHDDHMKEGAAMRTGTYTWRPTPNRRAALASAGAVTERIASDSHAFAYEGAPTVPVGKTMADYRAQRARGNERFSRSTQLKEKAGAVAQRERSGRQQNQTTTRRAGGRLAVFAVGLVAAFFGVAGAAFAASANTAQFRPPGASTDRVQAKFRAYDGENNQLEISRETSPLYAGNDWIEFRDQVGIDPHWGWLGSHGCDQGVTASPVTARCEHWSLLNELELDLGDENDRLQVHPTTPSRLRIRVQGGDGNDDIDFRDGAGGDFADCGPGTDWAFGDSGDTRANCENESLGGRAGFQPGDRGRGTLRPSSRRARTCSTCSCVERTTAFGRGASTALDKAGPSGSSSRAASR